MKLINTDGMAFIGPGSEWFWTALSGIVLAVTFLAIYRQLDLQRSAASREELDAFDRQWDSERMVRHRLAVLVALRDGVDPESVPEGSANAIANFWDKIGQLARHGDQDRKVLYATHGLACKSWWDTLRPMVQRWRTQAGDQRAVEDFEWMVSYIEATDRRLAAAATPHGEVDARLRLEANIANLEHVLRIEQALRATVIAQPDGIQRTTSRLDPLR